MNSQYCITFESANILVQLFCRLDVCISSSWYLKQFSIPSKKKKNLLTRIILNFHWHFEILKFDCIFKFYWYRFITFNFCYFKAEKWYNEYVKFNNIEFLIWHSSLQIAQTKNVFHGQWVYLLKLFKESSNLNRLQE